MQYYNRIILINHKALISKEGNMTEGSRSSRRSSNLRVPSGIDGDNLLEQINSLSKQPPQTPSHNPSMSQSNKSARRSSLRTSKNLDTTSRKSTSLKNGGGNNLDTSRHSVNSRKRTNFDLSTCDDESSKAVFDLIRGTPENNAQALEDHLM